MRSKNPFFASDKDKEKAWYKRAPGPALALAATLPNAVGVTNLIRHGGFSKGKVGILQKAIAATTYGLVPVLPAIAMTNNYLNKVEKRIDKNMNKQAALEEIYQSAFEDELEKVAAGLSRNAVTGAIAKRLKSLQASARSVHGEADMIKHNLRDNRTFEQLQNIARGRHRGAIPAGIWESRAPTSWYRTLQ